jgi:threonine dehydrogenase-like Zn-dependent dehydrogenase
VTPTADREIAEIARSQMRALLFGVAPEPFDVDEALAAGHPLLARLPQSPTRLVEHDEPRLWFDDWVLTKPRLVGICGSDAKQVMLDFGEARHPSNPMQEFFSLPHVLGHEVVADVVAVGPAAEGLEPGDRVALNPWLTCAPRGVDPVCPACAAGDLSLCWSFAAGPIAPGIHIGTCRDVPGGYADLMAAHDSMLHRVPDGVPDELAVFADPFAVSLHSVTRHPPPPGGVALVYGAGALGTCATAILRALYPEVTVGVVARFAAQADLARSFGATVFAHEPADALIAEVAAWSGGRLRASDGLPMAFPGGVDVVYDTVGKRETLEVGVRVLRARGTMVKAGVHGITEWEWTPLYFKEITWVGSNAFGVEEVEGERAHGIRHYLDLVADGRIDLGPMLTHRFDLDDWRDAFAALATQDRSAAVKVAFDFREHA